jgi:hypothetical protein
MEREIVGRDNRRSMNARDTIQSLEHSELRLNHGSFDQLLRMLEGLFEAMRPPFQQLERPPDRHET